jgi:hypothetical protein
MVGCAVALQMGLCVSGFSQDTREISIAYDKTVMGFVHPESVAYDPKAGVLYVGQFGSVLKPTLKDGKGRISRVSLTGDVLEEQFLPSPGAVLNKPKGIWVHGSRLWVTDIDAVWVFDLKTRRGRKTLLLGAKFANDPIVVNNVLYVSDTGGRQIFKVQPADFLDSKANPKVSILASELPFSPNGLYPASDGLIIVVGYGTPGHDQGIYTLNSKGTIKVLAEDIGQLDGVAQLEDGSLLVTDWKSRSLIRWNRDVGVKILVKGFRGPADFCIIPKGEGYQVVVPDLVKSELRMIGLSK